MKNRRQYLLSENTKNSTAIFDGCIVMKNRGSVSFFVFENVNEKIVLDINGSYTFLQKGDTVLIKYSIKDPNVAEVIDFCYMKKHKGKSYCE